MIDNKRKIAFALILIIVGAILLADNLNLFYIYIPFYLRKWYTFFVFIGLFLLLVRDKMAPGIVMIALGGLFMISDIFDVRVFSLWPAGLIVLGIIILFRKKGMEFHADSIHTDDYLDELAVFSGPNRKIRSKNFKGGKVTTVFGGTELDFSSASLAEGKNVIDIFTIFGGTTIYVPQDWDVKVNVTPIFGGYSDERRLIDVTDNSRQLIITGTVIFGGGELKTKIKTD